MLRAILAVGLSLAAIIMIVAFIVMPRDSRATDIMLNLGTEVIGIALTVAIVDWLIERNKLRDAAQRMAWRMLHDMDHAVWVWQGGRREFHLDELYGLLDLVGEHDPLPECTKELIVNLGSTASDDLRLHRRLMKFDRRLKQAVTYLAGLAQLRELDKLMTNAFIVQSLQQAIHELAGVVDQQIHPGTYGVARTFRDCGAEAQTKRYHGSRHDSIVKAAQQIVSTETSAGAP